MGITANIVNTKGLFASASPFFIITIDELQKLREKAADPATPKTTAALLDTFVKRASALPKIREARDPLEGTSAWQHKGDNDGHGWYQPLSFGAKPPTAQDYWRHALPTHVQTMDDAGWTGLAALFDRSTKLPLFKKALGDDPRFSRLCQRLEVTFVTALVRRINKAEVSIVLQDTWSRLGKTETCLVYGRSHAYGGRESVEGYVNSKGNFGDLAGARLFESPAAARRAGSVNFSNNDSLLIVRAELVIKEVITDDLSKVSSMTELQEAIAILEREQLQKALARADEQELMAQLEVLRKAREEEIPTPVKRRL
jgi:hypothetical protein